MYKLKVNGKYMKFDVVRVSAVPFNRVWPGKQRDIGQSEIAYVARIIEDSPVKIEIQCDNEFSKAVIRPLSKAIYTKTNGKTVEFILEKHGQYVLETQGEHHAIHIFYDKEKDFSEYGEPTYYFGPGEHNPGLIRVKNGDRIYIDRDAVVHGSIYGIDVSDIKIYGYGMLDGGWEERTKTHGDLGWDDENVFNADDVHTYGGIRFYRTSDIMIDGVTVCDPASYAISFFASDNIRIDSTKVVGLWKYNNDGIDFFNCENIELRNSFVRSFDDGMCLKGITAFSDKSVKNVEVENCVFWCGWGLTLEIGVASACPEIANVTYRNCDLIHNDTVAMSVNNGQWAYVHDVLYENINVEYTTGCRNRIVQKSDDEVYKDNGEIKIPELIRVIDYRRNWQGHQSYEDPRCRISDILYRDINIYMEEGVPAVPQIYIKKCMKCSNFKNIIIDGIYINGKKADKIDVFGNETDEVTFLE